MNWPLFVRLGIRVGTEPEYEKRRVRKTIEPSVFDDTLRDNRKQTVVALATDESRRFAHNFLREKTTTIIIITISAATNSGNLNAVAAGALGAGSYFCPAR